MDAVTYVGGLLTRPVEGPSGFFAMTAGPLALLLAFTAWRIEVRTARKEDASSHRAEPRNP